MKTPEELLTRVMNHLAGKFRNRLILKGGMLLRLYNSPRLTQDVDFVLLSRESKKKLKEGLIEALRKMPEIKIARVEVNSRGIFVDVADKEATQKVLIEVNVEPTTHLPPEPLSTANLSQKYSLSSRVISTMALPEAFSHKLAATLERDTMRDMYDLSRFEAMGSFDLTTLKDRLSRLFREQSQDQFIFERLPKSYVNAWSFSTRSASRSNFFPSFLLNTGPAYWESSRHRSDGFSSGWRLLKSSQTGLNNSAPNIGCR